MDRRFLLILLVLAVVFGGFLAFNKKGSDDSNGGSNNSSGQPSSHTYGEGKSGVVLIEYGDFQCPACKAYYPIIKDVKEKYKEQITVQFRHFPLESIHPNARAAHRAAEAAGKQNKFWEMHDLLYENQDAWASLSDPAGIFEDYATRLSLNIDQFKSEAASSDVNSIINADISEGQKIKATSTPTFVLDGVKIEQNPRSVEDFYKLIDEAIAKKQTGYSWPYKYALTSQRF